jgi:glycosyltransferase involved in cell wall biosynthesis
MVSVVIATYNRCEMVREAVASVIAQTDAAMEVIVVDDGSADDTASVLESFGSAIRLVLQSHRGVSAARNTGIRAAAGEWLAFLDSDDLWLPRKLRVQLEFFRKHREFRICQTEEIWVRNGRKLNPKKYHKKPRGHCFPQLLERCLISPSAVMIHREVFAEVGFFDESLPVCEDYDLWLRIGYRYPIGLIEEPLTIKRGGHADQLSNSIPAFDLYRIQALANLLQKERVSLSQRDLALQALGHKCRIYGEGCRKRERFEESEFFLNLPSRLAREPGLETKDCSSLYACFFPLSSAED